MRSKYVLFLLLLILAIGLNASSEGLSDTQSSEEEGLLTKEEYRMLEDPNTPEDVTAELTAKWNKAFDTVVESISPEELQLLNKLSDFQKESKKFEEMKEKVEEQMQKDLGHRDL